jgi:hypothetical protein
LTVTTNRDPLYRDDVLRARRLAPSDKLLEGPRLFEFSCRIILDGLRHRHPDLSDAALQERLRRSLDVVRRLEQLPCRPTTRLSQSSARWSR